MVSDYFKKAQFSGAEALKSRENGNFFLAQAVSWAQIATAEAAIAQATAMEEANQIAIVALANQERIAQALERLAACSDGQFFKVDGG